MKSHNVETAKEVIEENYQENNVEEINKKIKQFEDTFKLMIKQKREDDKEKLILKADLMKGNARVANMTKDQESKGKEDIENVQDENEEYLTDSEEERVHRNKHSGRGFLNARRSSDRLQNQDNKCPEYN